jgi:hypothetical protein
MKTLEPTIIFARSRQKPKPLRNRDLVASFRNYLYRVTLGVNGSGKHSLEDRARTLPFDVSAGARVAHRRDSIVFRCISVTNNFFYCAIRNCLKLAGSLLNVTRLVPPWVPTVIDDVSHGLTGDKTGEFQCRLRILSK